MGQPTFTNKYPKATILYIYEQLILQFGIVYMQFLVEGLGQVEASRDLHGARKNLTKFWPSNGQPSKARDGQNVAHDL